MALMIFFAAPATLRPLASVALGRLVAAFFVLCFVGVFVALRVVDDFFALAARFDFVGAACERPAARARFAAAVSSRSELRPGVDRVPAAAERVPAALTG